MFETTFSISNLPSPPYSESDCDFEKLTTDYKDYSNWMTIDWESCDDQIIPYSRKKRSCYNLCKETNFMNKIKPPMVTVYPNTKCKSISMTSNIKCTSSTKSPNKKDTSSVILPNKAKKNGLPTGGITIQCHVCDKAVESLYFKNHLFFGSISCKDCGWIAEDCSVFRKRRKNSEKCHSKCKNLNWLQNPVTYIKSNLSLCHQSKIVSNDKFKLLLNEYVDELKILWDATPWNNAIDSCRIHLSDKTEKPPLPLQSNSPVKRRPKPKRKSSPRNEDHNAKRKSLETLHLPSDGNYLIVKHPIEECPQCYTEICPTDLKVNCVNALISTNCSYCNLLIHFVIPPPDGSEHPIQIVI